MSGMTTVGRELEITLNAEQKTLKFARVIAKAVTLDELYGAFNPASAECSDGVFSSIIRKFTCIDRDTFKWTVLDGPIDPE
jgi:dynein heavy chain